MGYRELIEELEREAEETIAAHRRQAEDELARFENEAKEDLERLRRMRGEAYETATEDEARNILADGEKRAMEIRLAAIRDLSGRLRETARSLLAELRKGDYGELFAALAEELPDVDWEEVLINPLDQELARSRFPEAAVIAVDGISGGMEVRRDKGKIRIRNTLETRLERAWPDLLPELVQAAYREIDRDVSAADR